MASQIDEDGYPPKIFGIAGVRHRVVKLRVVLRHYGVFGNYAAGNLGKELMVTDLKSLECTVDDAEHEEISAYFQDKQSGLPRPSTSTAVLHLGGNLRGRPYLIKQARWDCVPYEFNQLLEHLCIYPNAKKTRDIEMPEILAELNQLTYTLDYKDLKAVQAYFRGTWRGLPRKSVYPAEWHIGGEFRGRPFITEAARVNPAKVSHILKHYEVCRETYSEGIEGRAEKLQDFKKLGRTIDFEDMRSIDQYTNGIEQNLFAPSVIQPELYSGGGFRGRANIIAAAREHPIQPSQAPSAGDAAGHLQTVPVPTNSNCSICTKVIMDKDALNPGSKITKKCQHAPSICKPCLTGHVDGQIQEVTWGEIGCPLCSEFLSYKNIKDYASPDEFLVYAKYYSLYELVHDQYFILCQNPNCDGGWLHTDGHDQPMATCDICQLKTCFTHQVLWHDGQTCDEYLYDELRE